MASWILHLRVAEDVLSVHPDLEPAAFAVGNIAPDSGIPDAKWEKFDPPAEVTHFTRDGFDWRCDDLGFYRRYLLPLRGSPDPGDAPSLSRASVSFRLGYFFHLLLDNLWDVKFNRPYRERYAAEFAADPEFIWKLKGDLYGLDFLHVRDNPESLFQRVFRDARPETGGLEFLPLEAVRQRVEYIQRFYTDAKEMQKACQRTYIFLTQPQMDDFVAESSQRILRIYQHLWLDGAPADGAASALDLEIGDNHG